MQPIRVLVVDDSAFMRKVITDIVNSSPEMEVVSRSRDGLDALKKIEYYRPDVVTMDIEMPVMNGLTTLARIMEKNPVPVIMLSSLTEAGARETVKALQLGAVDFIAKPSGHISLDIDKVKGEIISKIKIAAATNQTVKKFRPVPNPDPIVSRRQNRRLTDNHQLNKLVLIGTSTGGPKALHQVIPQFPADIDAAILVVQHMPAGFTRSLAERLNSLSQIKVKEAEDGEEIIPGCAYIAPGDYHLRVITRANSQDRKLMVNLKQDEPKGGHRPSVDVMLESVAGQFWSDMVGVIMTGMGHDGTAGLKHIKLKGASIIAEHQSSCIVYGMPKSAVETGMVDRIVPLESISTEVIKMLG